MARCGRGTCLPAGNGCCTAMMKIHPEQKESGISMPTPRRRASSPWMISQRSDCSTLKCRERRPLVQEFRRSLGEFQAPPPKLVDVPVSATFAAFAERVRAAEHSSVRTIAYSIRPSGVLAVSDGSKVTVTRVDRADGKPVVHASPLEISAIALSLDGSFLAVADENNEISIRSAESAGSALVVKSPLKLPQRAVRIVFAPTISHRLAAVTEGGVIHVWDLDGSGTATDVYTGMPQGGGAANGRQGPSVADIAFTADGQQLLCGCTDGSARLIDLPSGTLRQFEGHGGPIVSVAVPSQFQESRRRIAVTGSEDRTCIVWDLDTAQVLCRLVAMRDGDWFVLDPANRFDTNRLVYTDAPPVHWVFSDDPLNPRDPSLMQWESYEPELLAKKLSRHEAELPPVANVAGLNRCSPEVTIEDIKPRGQITPMSSFESSAASTRLLGTGSE